MINDLNIKKLGPEDTGELIELIRVFEEVFERRNFQMPDTGHLDRLLSDASFHAFVAIQGTKLIGGLTAYTLQQYYSVKPLAYIYDLAVLLQWQRKGIGSALIARSRQHFQSLGYEEIFLQADRADEYAIDFYRRTLPTEEENVAHFYYTL